MSVVCLLIQIAIRIWVVVFIVSLLGCSSAEDRAFRMSLVEKQLEYQSHAKAQPPLAKVELYEGGGLKSFEIANPTGYQQQRLIVPNSETQATWQTGLRMLAIPLGILANGAATRWMQEPMAGVATTALQNVPQPVVVPPSYPPVDYFSAIQGQ